MCGTMLVRVYYDGSEEGDITTWNDIWPIDMAVRDWLSGIEWFEILAYYPDETAVRDVSLINQFLEAERRHASCP